MDIKSLRYSLFIKYKHFFIILWCKFYSVLINKFSLLINLWYGMYFELVLFVNWSIMMTCACFFSWKCLIANMASAFFYFFAMTTQPDIKVSLRFSYVFIFPLCTRKLKCVWFFGLLVFKDWWRNHLFIENYPIIY